MCVLGFRRVSKGSGGVEYLFLGMSLKVLQGFYEDFSDTFRFYRGLLPGL